MNPITIYSYLTLSRQRILDWSRPLAPGQYSRDFPIGRGSLARTLTHIMAAEWYYILRLRGLPAPEYELWPIREENPPAFADLEAAWSRQAARTREAIEAVRDWDAPIEYQITSDDGRPEIVTASAADIFTQLVLHEVHHRAQAMNILRHLGIAAEDIDYNTLMYKRRPAEQG